jgi:hypothetical protein
MIHIRSTQHVPLDEKKCHLGISIHSYNPLSSISIYSNPLPYKNKPSIYMMSVCLLSGQRQWSQLIDQKSKVKEKPSVQYGWDFSSHRSWFKPILSHLRTFSFIQIRDRTSTSTAGEKSGPVSSLIQILLNELFFALHYSQRKSRW